MKETKVDTEMSSTAIKENKDYSRTKSVYDTLEPMCVARLTESLGEGSSGEARVFNRQLRHGRWDRTYGTEDLTSTAICLIGLSRSGCADTVIHGDKNSLLLLDDMLALAKRHRYDGGFGLILWANAVMFGLEFEEVVSRCGVALDRPELLLRRLTTMENAWLVSGLLHQKNIENSGRLADISAAAVDSLEARFVRDSNLFMHSHKKAPLDKRIRRSVPNFADQIYSIQALSLAQLAGDTSSGLQLADNTAAQLVALQGELGQWWWHYDLAKGKVAKGYPVYSVHQHAMAPMALMTLEKAGGASHRHAIDRSFAWLVNNEARINMIDPHAGTIWRDIEPRRGVIAQKLANFRSILGFGTGLKNTGFNKMWSEPEDFRRNMETRPYEWGWCLYAQAIAERRPAGQHLV